MAKDSIQKLLDSKTSGAHLSIPGVVFGVVDRDGKSLWQGTSGNRGLGEDEEMTDDTVFWIASCTKAITGVAALQLVQQGKLKLDEPAESFLPIISKLQIVSAKKGQDPDQWHYRSPTNKITLRMLLNHTAGLGYTFLNHEIKEIFEKRSGGLSRDEFCGE